MKTKAIAYPFAYDTDRVPVSIEYAKRGSPYFCVGCKKPMIPRLGNLVKHHFAHKTRESCQPDNALHETSKIHITKKFNKLAQAGKDFAISVPCSKCKQPIRYNLTANGIKIKQEATAIEGTRSDLVVFKNDSSPHTIIEIVVTHDLEPNTSNAYLKSRFPIIKIRPSWDKLTSVESTMNITCEKCIIRNVDVKFFMSEIPKNENALKQITQDKFCRTLFPKIRNIVNKYARVLVDCGFVQQSRPTLFMYESDYWKVYADLDSTDVMPIWEVDGEPALYAYPKAKDRGEVDCHPDCRECVLEVTAEKLHDAGMTTRRYFFDSHGFHWHLP